jgi:ACT domain-containing protein
MKKELSFITVIGRDQKGIVAKISDLLYKNDINIEDISQKVMEGVFVMTMLVDMAAYRKPLTALVARLEAIGSSMGLKIQIQHENLFKTMHRV